MGDNIINYEELSKEISYALRHAPDKYGLKLDDNGWVSLSDLINAFRKDNKHTIIDETDIITMIELSDKKRHEINDGMIRTIYGHSIKERIMKEPSKPPTYLYHGTAHKFIDNILKIGLIPKERQYVHLSEDIETALSVGKRRDPDPVILRVEAKRAWDNGIMFYKENEKIWLSDSIPEAYLLMD